MKMLILIFTLSLTVGAFAEDLGLSDCTKGNDNGRSSVKTSTDGSTTSTVSTETTNG